MPVERILDLALAIVAGEVVLLFVLRRRLGMRPVDVVGQLLAGVFLMIAVRCALHGDRLLTLAFVSASFPAHLFDLARRRSAAAAPPSVSPSSPAQRLPPL